MSNPFFFAIENNIRTEGIYYMQLIFSNIVARRLHLYFSLSLLIHLHCSSSTVLLFTG
jgi:hypothetical protein